MMINLRLDANSHSGFGTSDCIIFRSIPFPPQDPSMLACRFWHIVVYSCSICYGSRIWQWHHCWMYDKSLVHAVTVASFLKQNWLVMEITD